MGLVEGILNFNEVHVALVGVSDFLIVWMILKPLMHVVESVLLSKLVSKADAEGKQTVEIVRILLMSFFESENCIFVLV